MRVYGYCITIKKGEHWEIQPCEEYRNLPAHYLFLPEALDRAQFLRSKGIECRVCSLIAESTDTAEEFERSRIDDDEEDEDEFDGEEGSA